VAAQVEHLIEGRSRDIGGFEVRRLLPTAKRRMVGPFIFFDEMGPAEFAPGDGIEVRPHPHIGLSTLTYLFEGRLVHRDSLGIEKTITPGAVNLMTAGRGITHSERADPRDRVAGYRMHGIQTWLALPQALEDSDPDFVHHPAADLPEVTAGAARVRLIAGAAFGAISPVAMPWSTLYADIRLPAGAELALPDDVEERAVYLVTGAARLAGATLAPAGMAILSAGPATLLADADSHLILIGGAPMDGPRHIWWNLVASDRARIEQAKADWQASAAQQWRDSRFTLPDGESEYIPLPE